MKRIVFTLLLCLVTVLAFSTGQAETTEQKPVELKAAHIFATTTATHEMFVMLAEKVKEYTGGMVTIVIYPAQQMGDERAEIEGLFNGTIDLEMMGAGTFSSIVPEVACCEFPFLLKGFNHAKKVIPEIMIPFMNTKTQPKGVTIIGYSFTGIRSTLLRNKPINTFEDLRGLKIRVPQNRVYISTFQAANANPTPVNWGEVYTALQTGVVDACEVTPEFIVGSKLYEVTKYFSLTQHMMAPQLVGIYTKSWEKIKPYQKEFLRALDEATKWHHAATIANDESNLQVMIDGGIIVNDPGPAERAKFRDAVIQNFYKQFYTQYPETEEVVNRIIAVNE